MRTKYENLRVWADSMALSERIYAVTRDFPRHELFGLTVQLRRAAVSVASNVAEGCGRYHTREFIQFVYISRGSLFEVMTLLELSVRLKYVPEPVFIGVRNECEDLLSGLSGLIHSLEGRRK